MCLLYRVTRERAPVLDTERTADEGVCVHLASGERGLWPNIHVTYATPCTQPRVLRASRHSASLYLLWGLGTDVRVAERGGGAVLGKGVRTAWGGWDRVSRA